MIESMLDLRRNCFQLFLGKGIPPADFARPYVSITDRDGVELFQCRFNFTYNSSDDYTETALEAYPVISFEDQPPTPIEEFVGEFGGRLAPINYDSNTEVFTGVLSVPPASYMQYIFEVSVASSNDTTFHQMMTWMYRTFSTRVDAVFVFNQVDLPDGVEPVGDFVRYRYEVLNSPRTDGVVESIFRFYCDFWMDTSNAVEHDVAVLSLDPLILRQVE